MIDSFTRENLETILLEAYGSFEMPNFSFVERRAKRKPYEKLLQTLSKMFDVTDQTDFNYAVCLSLLISLDEKSWVLDLSLVGPFAVFLRVEDRKGAHACKLLNEENFTAEESKLSVEIEKAGLLLMKKTDLEMPVAMPMSLAVPEDVAVYHALFSDVYALPWSLPEGISFN